jgi:hypothetical protein
LLTRPLDDEDDDDFDLLFAVFAASTFSKLDAMSNPQITTAI